MKQLLLIIAGVVVIASLVVSAFTYSQVREQQAALLDDLQHRTTLLADSFKESIRSPYTNNATSTVQAVLDKFAGRERLLGLVVYSNKGEIFATSAGLSADLTADASIPEQAMDADGVQGDFFDGGSLGKTYILATPLRQNEKVIGALAVYQKADYIQQAINKTWQDSVGGLLVLVLVFSLAIILFLRWVIFRPILKIVESIRQARIGQVDAAPAVEKKYGWFGPITAEVSKMSKSLLQARNVASEEARLRLQKIDTPWTEERLKEFIKAYLKDRKIFVVSNREPYIHSKVKNAIQWTVPASGMVTALEPIMEACGGLWLAHGSGDADKQTVDKNDKLAVPPDDPKYTLKRLWLSEKEINGYYNGFANEAMWPLCLLAHNRPIFRQEDWLEYRKVNGKFAQSLLKEIKDAQRPIVLMQDYHLALLPEMIKKSRPDAEVAVFWHIPWPNAETFSICPWRKEILVGLLGADVVGFHTQQYCNNFMDTVSKELESLVDLEKFTVTHKGHTAQIKPFPISVAFTGDTAPQESPSPLLAELSLDKIKYLGLGVDRLDYTKGILEKLRGVEFFFDMNPDFKEQFTLLQIAAPSREGVAKYREFNEDVTAEAERINKKLSTGSWQPIVLLKKHYSHEEIYGLYRAANVCLVTSLSDGMNLVAKEFITARNDEAGVLILSQFTGATRDLKAALVINPYSAEETAEAIRQALVMPESEQHRRMTKMREAVKNYNIYRWAAEFIKAVASLG